MAVIEKVSAIKVLMIMAPFIAGESWTRLDRPENEQESANPKRHLYNWAWSQLSDFSSLEEHEIAHN